MAGVLNSPFYSGDAAEEENLGGIGMIIAHEITHAFDSSGSQYDSNGNLRNWWAQDDAKKFEELGQSVVEYYSAQSVRGMQVDGQLTLGENIADLGAMACVSAVAKQRGLDLRKVYAAYANLWAEEVRDEYLADLVTTDSHSPGRCASTRCSPQPTISTTPSASPSMTPCMWRPKTARTSGERGHTPSSSLSNRIVTGPSLVSDTHMRAEPARVYRQPFGAQRVVEPQPLFACARRIHRAGETRAVAMPHLRVERELRNGQHGALDVAD